MSEKETKLSLMKQKSTLSSCLAEEEVKAAHQARGCGPGVVFLHGQWQYQQQSMWMGRPFSRRTGARRCLLASFHLVQTTLHRTDSPEVGYGGHAIPFFCVFIILFPIFFLYSLLSDPRIGVGYVNPHLCYFLEVDCKVYLDTQRASEARA